MTEKAIIILQLDILGEVEEAFLYTARTFGAKALLKTVEAAATTNINVACIAMDILDESLPLAALISQFIKENISLGVQDTSLI